MTKAELAQAVLAYAQQGKTITPVEEGTSGRITDPALRGCRCGCRGDYTDHTMRMGEGRFADQR